MDRKAEVLLIVKFKTALTFGEVMTRSRERMAEFQALSGLVQKYYCHEETSGEVAGVYLWDSRASLEAFLGSELRESIAKVYEIQGAPRIDILDVAASLRP